MEKQKGTALHGRHVLVLGSGTLQTSPTVPQNRIVWFRRHHLHSQVRRGSPGGSGDSQAPPSAAHAARGHVFHQQLEHYRRRSRRRWWIHASSVIAVVLLSLIA